MVTRVTVTPMTAGCKKCEMQRSLLLLPNSRSSSEFGHSTPPPACAPWGAPFEFPGGVDVFKTSSQPIHQGIMPNSHQAAASGDAATSVASDAMAGGHCCADRPLQCYVNPHGRLWVAWVWWWWWWWARSVWCSARDVFLYTWLSCCRSSGRQVCLCCRGCPVATDPDVCQDCQILSLK